MSKSIEVGGVRIIGGMLALVLQNGVEVYTRASEIVGIVPAQDQGRPVIGLAVVEMRGGVFIPNGAGAAGWMARTYTVKHPPESVAKAIRAAEWREVVLGDAKQMLNDTDAMDPT